MPNHNNLFIFSEFHLTVIMDIFLQQKDIKTETLMPMTTSCGLPKLWLNTLFAILLCNKLYATMLWSCEILTRNNYILGVTVPLVAFVTWDKQGQSPVQKNFLKTDQQPPPLSYPSHRTDCNTSSQN